MKDNILTALKKLGKASATEIKKEIGNSNSCIYKRLNSLYKTSLIEKREEKNYGKRIYIYNLK